MRKNLLFITGLFIAFGFLAALIPFVQSMTPSARTLGALPRIDLSQIKPGEYKIINQHTYSNNYNGDNWGVLVIHKSDGEFELLDIVLSSDKVAMPNIHWWNSYYSCDSFGPTVSNGKILEEDPITCHDQDDVTEWSRREWRWSLSGENLGILTDDLYKTKGVIENNVFTFSKRS